jgi:hypothetical protein
MTARPAKTYRAARRNAWRASDDKWPQAGVRYVPFKARADRLTLTPQGYVRSERKQPKKYPYASVRQNTRNKWRLERFRSANPQIFAVAA